MASKVDPAKVIAAIQAGDLDDNAVDIAVALAFRNIPLDWIIEFDGHKITRDSVKVATAMRFEEHTGLAWANAKPGAGTTLRVAVIAAYLEGEQGMTFKDAMALIEARPIAELEHCLTEFPAGELPKGDSSPLTPDT